MICVQWSVLAQMLYSCRSNLMCWDIETSAKISNSRKRYTMGNQINWHQNFRQSIWWRIFWHCGATTRWLHRPQHLLVVLALALAGVDCRQQCAGASGRGSLEWLAQHTHKTQSHSNTTHQGFYTHPSTPPLAVSSLIDSVAGVLDCAPTPPLATLALCPAKPFCLVQ